MLRTSRKRARTSIKYSGAAADYKSLGPRRLFKKARTSFRQRRRNQRTAGFLGIETKFLDTAWDSVTVPVATADATGLELQPSTGCINSVSVPAQGDGEQQRDGRTYVLKSCHFSGELDHPIAQDANDATEGNDIYVAMVLDTQANGSAVNSEDVYDNPSTVGAAMFPYPLRNLENSKRFRILASGLFRLRGMYSINDGAVTGSLSAQAATMIQLSWHGSIKCNAGGTAAAVSNARDNSISIIAFSNRNPCTFRGKCRTRFVG